MYSAPTVSYPLVRSRVRQACIALPWGLGGCALLAWWLQQPFAAWAHIAALAVWLVTGGLLIAEWRRRPEGSIQWDGAQWQWHTGAEALGGTVTVRLDLQDAMLLEFRPPQGRALWLWPRRAADPVRWDDFRRAVAAGAGLRTTTDPYRLEPVA